MREREGEREWEREGGRENERDSEKERGKRWRMGERLRKNVKDIKRVWETQRDKLEER